MVTMAVANDARNIAHALPPPLSPPALALSYRT
jgi:hypothetical protein